MDIDPGAVEIAKLRLWLSLVDEEDIRQIKPLPNLDYKIVQGNSLLRVEHNLFNQQQFATLEKLKPLYFNETSARKKQDYKRQIDALIREITANNQSFDFEIYFSEVFHEKAGFDVVIANPPYIDSETMTRTDPDSRDKYSSTFKSARGNWDLFIVFIERGLQILKAKGTITYIVPNKLIAARYAETLREMLLEKDIKEIRDFSNVDVFKEVDVYPIVFLIQNEGGGSPVTMTSMTSLNEVGELNKIPARTFYRDTDWARYFAPEEILKLIVKLSDFPPLSKWHLTISGAATVSEAYEFKKYIRELTTQKKFRRFVNTGTIDRYLVLWGRQRTQYIKHSYRRPILQDDEINAVNPKRLKQSQSEKLIVGGMTKELECAYDNGELMAGKSTTIILSNSASTLSLKVVLALLNSSLISFWYRYFFKSLALAGGFLRISEREISQIPVPEISKAIQSVLSERVESILAITSDEDYLENATKRARVRDRENEIDQMVYNLYGITPEEMGMIEGTRPSRRARRPLASVSEN